MTVARERRVRAEGQAASPAPSGTRARRGGARDRPARRARRTASRHSSPAASASVSRSPARSSTVPQVLLLDEPLGALDLKLRQEMQIELKRIQQEVGITFVYVTHDQEEALTMSDRLAVFNARADRAGRHSRRGLRAPGDRVRRGLRRRLERARAAVNGQPSRFTVRPEKIRMLEEHEPAEPGAHVRARPDSGCRLRRDGHALHRRPRRRRSADRRHDRTSKRRPARCSRLATSGSASPGAQSTPT